MSPTTVSRDFGAAEELSDNELSEFSDFAIDHYGRVTGKSDCDCSITSDGSLRIKMGGESFCLANDHDVSVAPMDLANELGAWAPKLTRHGLISDDVKERQWDYPEDSERHIDEPGTAREITWWVYLTPASIRLARFFRRAATKPL